jgi:deoxyribodipyrimidine photo-lyase
LALDTAISDIAGPETLLHTRQFDRVLVWFRRDLRLADHTALSQALARSRQVWCAFVFDTEILDALPSRCDRRVEFIWHALVELDAALRARGGGLIVRHARARDEIPRLAAELRVEAVFANRDYEPAAVSRDEDVARRLAEAGARLETFKDQVIFERDEIMTGGGTPYSVFTPYKNAWLKRLEAQPFKASGLSNARALAPPPQPVGAGAKATPQGTPAASDAPPTIPTLESLGFRKTNLLELPLHTGMSGAEKLFRTFLRRIDDYDRARDFPSVKGPSYLSVHLRFGTVSIRHLVAHALALSSPGARVWLSELIWREFYFQILHHHPRVVDRAFKPEFEQVHFDNDPARFAAWCEGRTGYPLVDAAMRQLNATGYMHNRLRMVTASFLVKDLHIDWRWGERHFAAHLNDFDLAANNGGWQWAASTGCDAQPYFRIFNPVTQSQKFDAEGKFIRRYVPELANIPLKHLHAPWHMGPIEQQAASCVVGCDYPAPIVDHDASRKITLERYVIARSGRPQ